jgi:flagellar biosynthesis protein FlhF
VIISTTRGVGGKGVQVTAAVEAPEMEETAYTTDVGVKPSWIEQISTPHPALETPAPKTTKTTATKEFLPKKPPATAADMAHILRYHNVPDYLAEQLWQTAKDLPPTSLEAMMLAVLQAHFDFDAITIGTALPPVLLMGPPGVGKTMTVAKMATEAVLARQKISIITADTVKAGGVEQLESFTEILSVALYRVGSAEELAQTLSKIPAEHAVIIDTPGVNPYDASELQELGKLIACNSRIEPLLVCSAGMDVQEATEMAGSFSYLGATKIAVTKIDATRRLGSVLAAAHAGNLSFSHFSRHAGAAEGLEVVKASRLAALLLYYPQAKR